MTSRAMVKAPRRSAQGWIRRKAGPLILVELRRWLHSRPAVRYIVANIDAAVAFYTGHLGFTIDMKRAPGFAALSRGTLRLYVNEPGAGGGGTATPEGHRPAPGGWNRLLLVFADLPAAIRRLRDAGCPFRNELVEGRGGKQILLEDPSGNLIELFEPHPPQSR